MGKKDVILIGRPGAGRTCMAKIMSGEEPPKTHISTVYPTTYSSNNGFFLFNIGKTIIKDTGGNDQNILTWKDILKDSFKPNSNELIFYVFDGTEFLKELNDHYEGGPIGAEIRNELSPAYGQKGLPNNLFFIATHRDKYLMGNLKEKILNKMKSIQEEYPGRYFFYQKMASTLHCINATNTDDVKQLFEKMVD